MLSKLSWFLSICILVCVSMSLKIVFCNLDCLDNAAVAYAAAVLSAKVSGSIPGWIQYLYFMIW